MLAAPDDVGTTRSAKHDKCRCVAHTSAGLGGVAALELAGRMRTVAAIWTGSSCGTTIRAHTVFQRHDATKLDTVRPNTTQYNPMQHSWHSTTQCRTVKPNTTKIDKLGYNTTVSCAFRVRSMPVCACSRRVLCAGLDPKKAPTSGSSRTACLAHRGTTGGLFPAQSHN